ncbi:MAG TPA: TlpA disulfide reductase family protein [Myxococcales bacterium]|nr:TlpA disulfide reductase family protein [Myxococcales bacterium]
MAESVAAKRSDAWIWAVVIVATGSVLALAIIQGNRRDRDLARRTVPLLSLPLLDGHKNSSIEPGRVTVVDFWATWCQPCRASMPRVQRLWQEYQARGLDIYSVDTDDESPDRTAQVREFLMQYGLTFPVVLDDGRASDAFQVGSIPMMVLVDKQGHVTWSHVGMLSGPRELELRAAIDRALATN